MKPVKDNRGVVSILPADRRLLERMAKEDSRSLTRQIGVLIREAAAARGMVKRNGN